jgi:hypothetical protein
MRNSEEIRKISDYEEKIRIKYLFLMKIFLLITLLFTLLVLIIFIGVYSWRFDQNWALLQFEIWVYFVTFLIVFFIILNIILFSHYRSVKKSRINIEKSRIDYINGKRVYEYSYPEGIEGGVFSKTYIPIDHDKILRIRTLMIPPEEIWVNQDL